MCPLLEVEDLHIRFGATEAVKGISFYVGSSESVALVGESGCGKSVTAMAILRLLSGGTLSGSIKFGGRELLTLPEEIMCRYRGSCISAIFQDPMTSLNPLMTIGNQIAEAVCRHQKKNETGAMAEAVELLKTVEIADPEMCVEQYPHQLSGGMRQRVMLAIALACRPQLLIADEPTTALDVTTQSQILRLLKKLQHQFGMSLLLITHDFGVVAGMSERVIVMKGGQILEEGTAEEIYHHPIHAYTHTLVKPYEFEKQPPQSNPEVVLEARRITKEYRHKSKKIRAVSDVSLKVHHGETLALVGESGSGKSTLARIVLQLEKQTSGEIFLAGELLSDISPKHMQVVFQNPYATLDPRMTIREILKEPFQIHKLPHSEEILIKLLADVQLPAEMLERYPSALSGGQRQRVGLARALAVEPKILVCDEPLSALDLATQQQILQLLRNLKKERNLTYVFITHDLSIVKAFADRVAVMYRGQIVETETANTFFEHPKHPYSQMLLASAPFRDPRRERHRQDVVRKPELVHGSHI